MSAAQTFKRLAGVIVVAGLLSPAGASAARPLDVGFTDVQFENPDSNLTQVAAGVGASTIRVNVSWRQIAPSKPANPTSPTDPAYNWASVDAAVKNADEAGVKVMFTTFWAPDWAEGPNRPSQGVAPAGSWKPNAQAFGQFARALATRYSGNFPDPANPLQKLPPIQLYEGWNEPNLSTYITPQKAGRKDVSAGKYVQLLNEFYTGIKSVDPGATVVTAGTAPFGDDVGEGKRTRPLNFWRQVFCLKKNGRPEGKCKNKPKFDVLAHHPINVTSSPASKPANKDELVTGNFGELRKILRTAEKAGHTGTRGKHQLFANEVWWESNPPDPTGVSVRKQAEYMAQAQYLLWKAGARAVYFLQVRDSPRANGDTQFQNYQTGILTATGEKKLSYQAVKFPFVTERKGKKIVGWGRSPATGKVTIQAKQGKGGYKKIATSKAKKGGTFIEKFRLKGGKAKIRAVVAGNKSLAWKQK